ncbi:IS66-like element accessory protein TnpA [Eoetvoesiella caeni]
MTVSEKIADSYRNLPRRRFTLEFKRKVVEQLLDSGLTVAEVAREHALHPNQLCRWRNEYRHTEVAPCAETEALCFVPVALTPATRMVDAKTTEQAPQAAVVIPTPRALQGEVGLRIVMARGEVQVLNGCAAPLLRTLIEALQ